MTLAQERDVWSEYQRATGEQRERIEEELLKEHEGLAHSVRRKFHFSYMEYEEMQQIAMIGLLNAIRSFDTSKGFQFSTYAVPAIYNYISMTLRAENTDKRRLNHQTLSLDVPVGDDNKKKNDLIELIVDPSTPVDEFITKQNTVRDIVKESKTVLTPVEYTAFWMRYGKDEQATLDEIAQLLGLSSSGAKLTVERAIFKLKNVFVPGFQSNHYHKWTEQDYTVIRTMILNGAAYNDMFKQFPQRTKESVRGCITRMKRKMKKEGLL